MAHLLFLPIFFLTAQCMVSTGRKRHGLIGYGITMYVPNCAYSCRTTIASSPLNCSAVPDTDMADMGDMAMDMTPTSSPECYATDDAFLQTLAYCISTHCGDLEAWKIEQWWIQNVAGIQADQPDPKETYQMALAQVVSPPTDVLVSGDPLNKTSLVPEEDYMANWNAQGLFEEIELKSENYG
ncbi:hypothetical protein LTS18_000639 [Coniosporium uncinatum]|uniref:Uncharacterized protein n=1 Tax=Coniosporium uncinatum TaxID=93489 RepID=A0ACC3D838_9PEZI|nr:hypothetical protein LTS18_000639 [Coniosporium uncinatum]